MQYHIVPVSLTLFLTATMKCNTYIVLNSTSGSICDSSQEKHARGGTATWDFGAIMKCNIILYQLYAIRDSNNEMQYHIVPVSLVTLFVTATMKCNIILYQ